MTLDEETMETEGRRPKSNNSAELHGCISVVAFCVLGVPSFLCGCGLLLFAIRDLSEYGWGGFFSPFILGFFGIFWLLLRAVLRDFRLRGKVN